VAEPLKSAEEGRLELQTIGLGTEHVQYPQMLTEKRLTHFLVIEGKWESLAVDASRTPSDFFLFCYKNLRFVTYFS